MRRFVVVLVLIGCGHPAGQPALQPTLVDHDPTADVSCAKATEHMVTAMAHADPASVKSMTDVFTLHCTKDNWSQDARSCMARVQTQADGQGCIDGLPNDQRRELGQDLRVKLSPQAE